MASMSRAGLALAACVTTLAVAGCGGPAPTPSAPPPPVTAPAAEPSAAPQAPQAPQAPEASDQATAVASPTPVVTTGPSVTLGAPAPSPAPGIQTSSGPRNPALVAVQPGTTVPLDLGSAFHADNWQAGQYQPAAAPARVPAYAVTVACEQPPAVLEYRLAPGSGVIKFSVAQDLLSDSSDNTLAVQLVADGRVVTEKTLTFKQTAELSAPTAGVTVVKLTAATRGTCRTSSVALVTQAVLQG